MRSPVFPRAALALGILAAPLAAHAQLDVELTPALRQTVPGGTAIFTGFLDNTGGSTLFLNDLSFVGDSPLGLDSNVFFANVPGILDPSGTFSQFTGTLFGITVAPGTAPGDYTGTVTFLGGADSATFEEIGSASLTVRVVAAPEPGSLALAGVGLLGLVAVRRRRRG